MIVSKVNRRQEDIRRKLHEALDEVLSTLVEDLKSLEPHHRVRLALQLSEFVLPRIRAEENDTAYHAEIMEEGGFA